MNAAETNTTIEAIKSIIVDKIGDTSDLNQEDKVDAIQEGIKILKGIYADKVEDKNCILNGEEIKNLAELYRAAEEEQDKERGGYDSDGLWWDDNSRYEIMSDRADKEARLIANIMRVGVVDVITMTFDY
jgi:hypothetical protein